MKILKLPLLPTKATVEIDPIEPAVEPPTPITRREHFSFSQLTMYLRCSMQYYFRYVLGRVEPPDIKLATGSGVHASLEWNSRHKIAKKVDMPVDDLRDLASDMIDIEHHEVEDTPKAKGDIKDKAINAVTFYRTSQAPDIQPLAVEHPFRLTVDPDDLHPEPTLPVIGFVDTYSEIPRPQTHPGKSTRVLAVEDYKWVAQKRSQGEVNMTPQLTLYDYVFNMQTAITTDVIGYRMFGFNSDGPYATPLYREREYMQPGVREMRWQRLFEQIRRVQDAIKKGIFIPTDDAKTCGWCGYRQTCQFSLIRSHDEPR